MKRVLWLLIIILMLSMSCGKKEAKDVSADKVREYANELYNKYLFQQAIDQYRYYISHYEISDKEKASITYRIAEIYFDRMHDYHNALAEYLKIKIMYPESELVGDANKRIVECLERLERPEDAKQALDETAGIEPKTMKKDSSVVIAKIGDRNVTQGELDFELSRFPPEVRQQFSSKEKKLELLRRYIATELMYDSAKRAGYDKDKDVIESIYQAKKSFMVQKLLQERLKDKIKIEPQELELYYQAHKDKFVEKDKEGKVAKQLSFEEVQNQVAQELFQEKWQRAYAELISSLLKAENVVIYDDLIK
jgi:hypothetical protein